MVIEVGRGHRQRLKERFLAGADAALTDEALLELLLTYAIPQKDVRPLARRLLASFGDMPRVLGADLAALRTIDGIGEHAAVLLRLVAWLSQNRAAQPALVPAEAAPWPETATPTPPTSATTHTHEPPDATSASAHELANASNQAVAGAPRDSGVGTMAPHEPARVDTTLHTPERRPHFASRRQLDGGTRWRASGPYTATNASKAGLVEETRLALLSFARLGDTAAMRRELLDGGLPQRSRATREAIVRVIQERLVAWHPPAWVYDDLVASAEATPASDLRLLLLLHTARQDTLFYDVVQQVIWPLRQDTLSAISRTDVQRFLDAAVPAHPEIDGWSLTTREKLAGNLLTIARDYGLLHGAQGSADKRIVEPVASPRAAAHLTRLLAEEGMDQTQIPYHDDWKIWLLDATRARTLLAVVDAEHAR